MKHLPIKSNDACDLKGITVKWCIQRDYGRLQMAGVQKSAKSFGSPHRRKAGGWTRDVFGHQCELNALVYKPLNSFITAEARIGPRTLGNSSGVLFSKCLLWDMIIKNVSSLNDYTKYNKKNCSRDQRSAIHTPLIWYLKEVKITKKTCSTPTRLGSNNIWILLQNEISARYPVFEKVTLKEMIDGK